MRHVAFAVMNETKERVVIRHATQPLAEEWVENMKRIFKDKTPVYVIMKITTIFEEL